MLIQCPHCGAPGRLMIPSLGVVIICPCPYCKEMVLIFCGYTLTLNKDTIRHGSIEKKHKHILEVITEHIDKRLWDILRNNPGPNDVHEADDDNNCEDDPYYQNTLDSTIPWPVCEGPRNDVIPQVNDPTNPIGEREALDIVSDIQGGRMKSGDHD